MRVRDRIGLNLSPLLLRVMLGAIVLWMGLGRILERIEVDGVPAAMLANMGVITPVVPATSEPAPAPEKPKNGALAPQSENTVRLVSQPATTARKYTAQDFGTPVKVRKLYLIALTIKAASEPGATKDGSPKLTTWPAALADGQWPVYLAWTAAVVETLAGVGLLLGLLTRLWAALMAGRMAAALWLVHIGPAIQSGDAALGFLPNHPTFDMDTWRPLVLVFALLVTSLALLFLGPGRASLDNAIFAPGRRDDDDEDEG